MWADADIEIEIDDAEGRTMIATVHTPAGSLTIIAELELIGDVLWACRVHVQGLSPGALGRAGLNALARRFLEEADAKALVVEGAARTTGANPHRRPRVFRFPH